MSAWDMVSTICRVKLPQYTSLQSAPGGEGASQPVFSATGRLQYASDKPLERSRPDNCKLPAFGDGTLYAGEKIDCEIWFPPPGVCSQGIFL